MLRKLLLAFLFPLVLISCDLTGDKLIEKDSSMLAIQEADHDIDLGTEVHEHVAAKGNVFFSATARYPNAAYKVMHISTPGWYN